MKGLAQGDEKEAGEAIDKADEFLKTVKSEQQALVQKKKHEPRDKHRSVPQIYDHQKKNCRYIGHTFNITFFPISGVNRTVINQKAFDDNSPVMQSGMSQGNHSRQFE